MMTPTDQQPMTALRVAHQNDTRNLVMQVLQDAVDDGYADWHTGDDGMECHLFTGEVFLLTDVGVTRLR
jgi:hypothetical protein